MILAIYAIIIFTLIFSGTYTAYDCLSMKKRYSKSYPEIKKHFKMRYVFIEFMQGLIVAIPLFIFLFAVYGFIEFLDKK